MLSRDQILQSNDKIKGISTVDVPEWGGEVAIRPMTGKEREAFEAMAEANMKDGKVRARVVALAVVDEQGSAIFTEADIDALADKSSLALDRVFKEVIRVNGLTKASTEELRKN